MKVKKRTTGWQTKMFHVHINEQYGWIDVDVMRYCRKSWFASVRANDQTPLINELATQLENAVDFIKRCDDWTGKDPEIESMMETLNKLKEHGQT